MKKELREERKKKLRDCMADPQYVPMKGKELMILLEVPKKEREECRILLEELIASGQVAISKKGKYRIAEQTKDAKRSKQAVEEPITGRFISHAKGFGFVEVEDREEDLFIPEGKSGDAFHGDTVQVKLLDNPKGKRQEAVVTRVLEHSIKTVVGTYEQNKNFGFVKADNTKIANDIFVSRERSKGAVDGHKVVVEITDYGTNGKKPEGKIIEILGHIDDPGVDIMSIVKAFDLPVEFDEKVKRQVERVSDTVSDADKAGRLDLREMQMVTIDGEDAKDLDDAVSVSMEGDCYQLGVHIADVSNYVQYNSALDREALERGTSVYLVDRVIPMLPHQLSNGICSLNEGVDRLALSCMMTIDMSGEVIDYKIAETVICVDRRMSYTAVSKILEEEDADTIAEYESLVPMFREMEKLALILRRNRKKRGSIDFDFPESKIILDQDGHPIDIKPYDRNIATKIIEDFMLIANETVAKHYCKLEIPFVYRTHEQPDPERIKTLSLFISNFGYSIKTVQEEVHPKELQRLLSKIDGTPEEPLISRLTLRSMRQARYTTECTGHFGLACEYYCHFTSPIRRYPDLQIHRIIKEQLRGLLNQEKLDKYRVGLAEVAKHASETERRADEAERETDKLKKVEFMESKIGTIYEGVISGITKWGMYVELPNTVEGMIRVSDLPGDYFNYDENTYEMVGQGTGKTYKLGEKIRVQLHAADKIARTIDFVIPEEE
ncbi:MAG: ribonuclease R [Lachnospiraceae bacterium]